MAKRGETSAHVWFPMYCRDWLADGKVRGCTGAQRGILVDLWCYQWQDGQLPNDLSALCRMLGSVEPSDVQHVVALFFEATSDGLFLRSPRLFREQKQAESLRQKKRAAIQKARNAKAAKGYTPSVYRTDNSPDNKPVNAGPVPTPAPTPSPRPVIGETIVSPLPPTALDDLERRRQAAKLRLDAGEGNA